MASVRQIMFYGERPKKAGDGIARYFERELDKMPSSSTPINISSDITEALLGYDKNKMSKNKRIGFTSGVLLLPLRLCCSDADSLPGEDTKGMLEGTTVYDIAKWGKDFLLPSQMVRRKDVLSA